MPLDADRLRRLSTLLDQALALPEPERATWIATLSGDDAALGPMLRDLLERDAGKATAELLPPIPALGAARVGAGAAEAGQLVGPYRLEESLGRGGMGEVWLASRIDDGPKRKVALKLPHVTWAPGLAERFARERDILAQLEHPHIARLYDAGVDASGRPYMALEHVVGKPIDGYCQARGLAVEARVRLLRQVTDAVAFAHGRLVVHRDLKPSNILVTAEGQVRLLDFGIAKLLAGDTARETVLTQVAGRALTLDYASPEQIRGEPIGTASDVYSLGVVAYELLAGARPYVLKRASAAELEEAIATADTPLASDRAGDPALKRALRGDLDAILNKALKKDARDRYPTVDALAQDLRRHLDGQAVAARPDTLTYRVVRFVRRYRIPLAASAVVIATFVLAQGFGATAVVIAALLIGLGAALWQARRAAVERDRAYALADRNSAANVFVRILVTQAGRGGPWTAKQLLDRSESAVETQFRGNAEHRASVLSMLAGAYSQIDEIPRALELAKRATDAARDSRDLSFRSVLESRQALWQGQLGNPREAIAAIDAILARSGIDAITLAEAHAHRSWLAQYVGDRPAMLHHCREALKCFQSAPHAPRNLEANYLGALAYAHFMNAQNDAADRHYASAVRSLEALGLDHGTHAPGILCNWGIVNQVRGDLPRALELIDRAIAAHRGGSADTRPSPVLVLNRAYVLARMGRYAEAEAACREARATSRERGLAAHAYHLSLMIAELYLDRGLMEDVAALIAAAREERPENLPEHDPANVSLARIEARIAVLRGDTQAAALHFTRVVGDLLPSDDVVDGLLGRSDAHLRAGAIDLARADATRALDMAKLLQGSRACSFRTGLAHLALARIAAAERKVDAARREAAAALPDLEYNFDAAHPSLTEARSLAAATPA